MVHFLGPGMAGRGGLLRDTVTLVTQRGPPAAAYEQNDSIKVSKIAYRQTTFYQSDLKVPL